MGWESSLEIACKFKEEDPVAVGGVVNFDKLTQCRRDRHQCPIAVRIGLGVPAADELAPAVHNHAAAHLGHRFRAKPLFGKIIGYFQFPFERDGTVVVFRGRRS